MDLAILERKWICCITSMVSSWWVSWELTKDSALWFRVYRDCFENNNDCCGMFCVTKTSSSNRLSKRGGSVHLSQIVINLDIILTSPNALYHVPPS